MANDIPAGWYPDIHGAVRWWDGQRWTDHVRAHGSTSTAPPEEPAEVSRPQQTYDSESATNSTATHSTAAHSTTVFAVGHAEGAGDEPPVRNPLDRYASDPGHATAQSMGWAPSAGATAVHHPSRTISYPKTVEEDIEVDDGDNRRVWLTATVVGLAAFFLGMGIGGRAQVDPPENSDPIPPAVNADSSDLDELRQRLEERQAELDERQQVLDEREDDLDRRASATPTPTPSPTATATETEIDGNDRVLVGTDVREGTYRTSGPTDPLYECEYSISEDEFGDDKISEDSTKSAASVRLRDGDWFETDDCQDWERD